MAKGAGRKLKVFQAQFGFFDTVVAAPSRAAALRAWGTHQDLFASGQARETTDPVAGEAARAYPETPLRRAVGTTDPFAREPTRLPEAPAGKPKLKVVKPVPPPAPSRSAADRSQLDRAEKALQQLDETRRREEAGLRQARADLEAREATSQKDYVAARKRATSKVVEAREAYRAAGGLD